MTKKKSKFFKRFYPTYIYQKVEDIPYELIKKEKIKLILLDMDNTLIDSSKKYNKKLKIWVENMKSNNVELHILSNSPFEEKVKKIAQKLDIRYDCNASKPLLKGFKRVIKKYEYLKKENILMVGDQIFTDVWGGNRLGVKTVLVTPINSKESILSKVKRPIERIVLKKFLDEGENK